MTTNQINPEREKLIQQKYSELYQLDMYIKQIEQQINAISNQLNELDFVTQELESLKDVEENTEVNCMFTPGIFIKTKIVDNKKVLLNVGSGTVVEKSIDDAKKLLEGQKADIIMVQNELMLKFEDYNEQARNLQKEFKNL